ncbi:cupin domain-containing protein [Chloroflexota bacterium]
MATYQQWVESLELPIHKGYYIEDLRTVEMGWWEERGCNGAFIQMLGQEGVAETRITGIPPGKTTQPWKFALDEAFYVLEGKGLATVWGAEKGARKTFEWKEHSLFLIPRQGFCQLTNAQGNKPATLLSYNYLPFAMQAVDDPGFFFNNPYVSSQGDVSDDFYSEAKLQSKWTEKRGDSIRWHGNFFPDMRVWDKLNSQQKGFRGANARSVQIQFPNWTGWAHMAVFPSRTYKKAHRHGPARFIVIPVGEGYSVFWGGGYGEEKERIFIPWHEASCLTPPDRWFHQHFNVGTTPARYLAFHPPDIFWGHSEGVEDRDRDQIEYPDEDPWVRQTFEKELAKRGLTSIMPEDAYKDRNYQWESAEDKE